MPEIQHSEETSFLNPISALEVSILVPGSTLAARKLLVLDHHTSDYQLTLKEPDNIVNHRLIVQPPEGITVTIDKGNLPEVFVSQPMVGLESLDSSLLLPKKHLVDGPDGKKYADYLLDIKPPGQKSLSVNALIWLKLVQHGVWFETNREAGTTDVNQTIWQLLPTEDQSASVAVVFPPDQSSGSSATFRASICETIKELVRLDEQGEWGKSGTHGLYEILLAEVGYEKLGRKISLATRATLSKIAREDQGAVLRGETKSRFLSNNDLMDLQTDAFTRVLSKLDRLDLPQLQKIAGMFADDLSSSPGVVHSLILSLAASEQHPVISGEQIIPLKWLEQVRQIATNDLRQLSNIPAEIQKTRQEAAIAKQRLAAETAIAGRELSAAMKDLTARRKKLEEAKQKIDSIRDESDRADTFVKKTEEVGNFRNGEPTEHAIVPPSKSVLAIIDHSLATLEPTDPDMPYLKWLRERASQEPYQPSRFSWLIIPNDVLYKILSQSSKADLVGLLKSTSFGPQMHRDDWVNVASALGIIPMDQVGKNKVGNVTDSTTLHELFDKSSRDGDINSKIVSAIIAVL